MYTFPASHSRVQTLLTYDLVLYIYTAIIKRTRRDPFFMALLYYIIMRVYIYNSIITIIHSNNVITRAPQSVWRIIYWQIIAHRIIIYRLQFIMYRYMHENFNIPAKGLYEYCKMMRKEHNKNNNVVYIINSDKQTTCDLFDGACGYSCAVQVST